MLAPGRDIGRSYQMAKSEARAAPVNSIVPLTNDAVADGGKQAEEEERRGVESRGQKRRDGKRKWGGGWGMGGTHRLALGKWRHPSSCLGGNGDTHCLALVSTAGGTPSHKIDAESDELMLNSTGGPNRSVPPSERASPCHQPDHRHQTKRGRRSSQCVAC